MMKPQEQSAGSSRALWIVAAALTAGAAVLVSLLWGNDDWRASERPVAAAAEASVKQHPQFTVAPQPAEVPALAADPAKKAETCNQCEERNRGATCREEMGCEALSGEDKVLCENLLTCLRANPKCASEDPFACYCGTARGEDCAKTPNGECVAEILAATKTRDPYRAGVRFYVTDFPSGRASQLLACHITACKDQCLAQVQ